MRGTETIFPREGWGGLAITAALLLTGCNTVPEDPLPGRIVEVQIPVAVSCVPSALPPFIPFSVTREVLLNAPDAAARYQLALQGFLEREARSQETEPVIAACRLAPETVR